MTSGRSKHVGSEVIGLSRCRPLCTRLCRAGPAGSHFSLRSHRRQHLFFALFFRRNSVKMDGDFFHVNDVEGFGSVSSPPQQSPILSTRRRRGNVPDPYATIEDDNESQPMVSG